MPTAGGGTIEARTPTPFWTALQLKATTSYRTRHAARFTKIYPICSHKTGDCRENIRLPRQAIPASCTLPPLSSEISTLLHNLNDPANCRYVRRIVNTRLDPRYVPMLRRNLEEQAEGLADSQADALNDSDHTLTGKRGEPEPATLGLTLYVFETQRGEEAGGTARPMRGDDVGRSPTSRRRSKRRNRDR